MIKKILMLVMVCSMTTAFAQDGGNANYSSGLGVRGGTYYGLTYKIKKSSAAYEFILSDFADGIQLAAFYQLHGATGLGQLDYYIGAGAHVGAADDKVRLGVDGVAGLEIQIFDTPFTFGLDIIPAIDIIGNDFFHIGGGAHLRYIW